MLLNSESSFHPGGLLSSMYLFKITFAENTSAVILDYGCGSGTTLSFLANLGFKNLLAFDVNLKSINLLIEKSKIKGLGIQCYTDVNSLYLNHQSIDYVLLESILSFNLMTSIQRIIADLNFLKIHKGLKKIGVIEPFYDKEPPPEIISLMRDIFGMHNILSREQLFNVWGDSFKVTSFREFRPLAPDTSDLPISNNEEFMETFDFFYKSNFDNIKNAINQNQILVERIKEITPLANEYFSYAVFTVEPV